VSVTFRQSLRVAGYLAKQKLRGVESGARRAWRKLSAVRRASVSSQAGALPRLRS
jgi:hypothetical protein